MEVPYILFVLILYLLYLSIIDIKKRLIKINKLLPLIVIIFSKIFLLVFNRITLYLLSLLYLIPVLLILIFYLIIDLIGGADFKIILILFLYYLPHYELNSIFKILQFLLFLNISFLIINSTKLLRNLYITLKLNVLQKKNLYIFFNYVFFKIIKVNKEDRIILKLPNRGIYRFLIYKGNLYGFIKKEIPLVPVILICFCLSLFL